jgi:hypothetical protein
MNICFEYYGNCAPVGFPERASVEELEFINGYNLKVKKKFWLIRDLTLEELYGILEARDKWGGLPNHDLVLIKGIGCVPTALADGSPVKYIQINGLSKAEQGWRSSLRFHPGDGS